MKYPKIADKIGNVLVGVAGVNWGLFAMDWNLVQWLEDFIGQTWVAETVYVLATVAGARLIYVTIKEWKKA